MRARAEDELGIGIAYGSVVGEYDTSAYDFSGLSPRLDLDRRPSRSDARSVVLNSAWLTAGGSCDPDETLLARLAEHATVLRPAYVCVQIAFNRFAAGAGTRATGLPLPAPRTRDGVAVAVRRIAELRERLGTPVAFEIGSNHLQAQNHELSSAEFYREIARTADCGIALDLAALWANERNGGDDAEALIRELPLERVWELQVSGCSAFGNRTLDTQSGLVGTEIRRLAESVVPTLPALRAVVYEVRPNSLPGIPTRSVLEQRSWLNALWETRGENVATIDEVVPPQVALPRYENARVCVAAWERAVVAGIAGVTNSNGGDAEAYGFLDQLIACARRAAIDEAAQLSLRLLDATLGKHALADLLRRYCAETCPEVFPVTEALRFLQFVERERSDVPYLREVVAFERAALRALRASDETAIAFPCEPTEIFRALLRHDRPYVSDLRPHVVHVGPRGIRIEGCYQKAG